MTKPSPILRTGALAASAVLWACAGSDLVLPSEALTSLQVMSGMDQAGTVGAVLSESLVVRVVDATGAGVVGVPVTWSASNGGSVSPTTSATDADGYAAAERTLGAAPGPYATTATAPVEQGSPVVFLATAAAGAPDKDRSTIEAASKSVVASSGSNVTEITVTVRDPDGNAVPGAIVTLSATGSGNQISQPPRTDAAGVAVGTFASTSVGTHVISAVAGGVALAKKVNVAVTPGAPSGAKSEIEVPGGGARMSTQVTVRLKDAFGNAVPGVRSKLTINVSGANNRSNLLITDAGGGEYRANYTPTAAGTDMVSVLFEGVALFAAPSPSVVVAGAAVPGSTVATVEPFASLFGDQTITITANLFDASGNPVRRAGEDVEAVAVFGSDRRAVSLSYDESAGRYVGVFHPWEYGNYTVEITVSDAPVPGSPFPTQYRLF